jgi:polyisoprenoid-binding protein YceI
VKLKGISSKSNKTSKINGNLEIHPKKFILTLSFSVKRLSVSLFVENLILV